MSWTEEFINQCLEEVPQGKYRTRTEKELRDHLESLCRELEGAGYTRTEAQTAALAKMGNPEQLRRRYRAEALRRGTGSLAWNLKQLWYGCLIMGCLYLMTAILLSWIGFTMDAVSIDPHTLIGRNFPILGDGPAIWAYYGTLFAVPYTLGALFLRSRFRKEPYPALWVTRGLLAAWAGEKGIYILLSALIYGIPPGPALLLRMSYGGDTTAPGFLLNMTLTLLGCLMLGHLLGQSRERRGELA